jgi:hypothetical protein
LPALVVVQKLIPEGVESSIIGIFKSLQAFSVGFYGRMVGVLIEVIILQGSTITYHLRYFLFFAMIVLAGLATIIFWLTSILPKEKDITETQQAIFYEMTLNRTDNMDRTGSELNMIHKMAQVRIHDSESLTSSADFILMQEERIAK